MKIKKYNLEKIYSEGKEENWDIPLSLYKSVIRDFWKEISKAILKGGSLSFGIGQFFIAENKRTIKLSKEGNIINNINWGASNKRKQELLNQGKIPFEATRDMFNEITGDNGGEPWLIYFTNDSFFSWVWNKNEYLKNFNHYKFRICKANRIALAKNINEDSSLLYSY